jgi:pilus assembly protein CpaF
LQGLTEEGKVKGSFRATGIRPKFMKQLEAQGIELPGKVFRETYQ